jgi:trigger factor
MSALSKIQTRKERYHNMRKIGFTITFCFVIACIFLNACSKSSSSVWEEDKPYQNYRFSDYVSLGKYKGIRVAFEREKASQVTQTQVSQMAKQICMNNGISVLKEDKSRTTVENGDIVLFEYEGKAPGLSAEILKGMKSEQPVELEIGSNMFIPGFEKQMIGKKVNTPFDIQVTFPASYAQQPELENVMVTFHCTVHKVGSATLDDNKISTMTQGQYNTVKEFEDGYVRPDLEQRALPQQAQERNKQKALEVAYKNAKIIKIPSKEIEYYIDVLKKFAEQNGQSVDDFLTAMNQFSGMEDYKKKMDDQVRRELFCFAVAEQEGLKVTDQELKAKLNELRGNDKTMTDQEVLDALGGKGMILRGLTIETVLNFVYKNAINTAKESTTAN